MQGPRRRWEGAALAVLGTLALASGGAGCKEGRDLEKHGGGIPDTGTSTGPRPTLTQRCPLEEEVVAPEMGTPEWVVHELYAAAAAADSDEDAAFRRFYARFDASVQEKWARSSYFAAARKHLAVVLPPDREEGEIVITLCRKEAKGDDELKVFVKSWDKKKSHLPITMVKGGDGGWKVSTYSP